MPGLKLELPFLGTAKWGHTVSELEAFDILDKFYEFGGRRIDTATNYPINSNPDDFGLALKWVIDWVSRNSITNLNVYLKLGAANNLGSSKTNFQSNHLEETIDDFIVRLGSNLTTIGIHWDNRDKASEETQEISKTIKLLNSYKTRELKLGFSGIKYPEIYFESNNIINDWIIQVKENIFTSDDRRKYSPYFPNAKFIAYGINSKNPNNEPIKRNIFKSFCQSNSGIAKTLNLESFFDLALLFSFCNSSLDSYIAAPSSASQLEQTINSLILFESVKLQKSNRVEIYKKIKKLATRTYE